MIAAAGYSSSEDITVKFDLLKDTLIIEISLFCLDNVAEPFKLSKIR